MRNAPILLLLTLVALPAWAGPMIVCDSPNIDLGIVEGDTVVPYTQFIRNDGDETLYIERVSVTCGCTVANLPDSTVEPGESVPLQGSLNTRKMDGEIHKALFIDSNDPERERLVLTLNGFVVREVSYYPKQVFFSNARVNETETKSITVRSGKDFPLAITAVHTGTDRYEIEIENLERSGDYRLDMVLLPQEVGQVIRDTLTIVTNIEGYKYIRIPILGKIR